MRTAKITIMEQEYMLTFSTYVLAWTQSEKAKLEKLQKENRIEFLKAYICQMSKAGSLYASTAHLGEYPVITPEILDVCTDINDLNEFEKIIGELIEGERTVDAEPPKNADTTREEAPKS